MIELIEVGSRLFLRGAGEAVKVLEVNHDTNMAMCEFENMDKVDTVEMSTLLLPESVSKVLVKGEKLTFDFISVAQLRVIKEVYEGFLNAYGEKEAVAAETEDELNYGMSYAFQWEEIHFSVEDEVNKQSKRRKK